MKIEATVENFAKSNLIISKIRENLILIYEDTAGHSLHNNIVKHESFKVLAEMGDKIIPYLFHLILEEGGGWAYFLLLNEITKENPTKKENVGKFIHCTIDWLQWYVNSKYYPSDIYFGLVD